MSPRKLYKFVVPALALAVSGLSVMSLQTQLLADESTSNQQSPQSTSINDIGFAQALDEVGYSGLGSSILWLSFIQYFGGEAGVASAYRDSASYIKGLTTIEPRFLRPYSMVISSLGFRAGQPEEGKEILEFGIERLTPDVSEYSYQLPIQLAILNFLFLGDKEGGRDAYHLASERYEKSYGEPADQWRDLGDNLYQNPRSDVAQFAIWSQVFTNSSDNEVRQRAYNELLRLGRLETLPNGETRILPPEE